MQAKKDYITGLKGISCIFILLGHFIGLYKYAEQFLPRSGVLDTILNSRFSFIINEAFWLYLFFYLSGYLVARSRVTSVKDFVLKSINRFFRFAFPILFSYLVIYVIYIAVGFHNDSTARLFQCGWFQSYYVGQYSIMDVLRSPIDVVFKGNSMLNGPYWVLKDMFNASIIIYAAKCCYCFLAKRSESAAFWLLIAVTFASVFYSNIIFACLLGMLISIYEDAAELRQKPFFVAGILLILLMQYIISESVVFNFFFVVLIILAPKIRCLDACLSIKPFRFLGDISWGIYSFHWPLICSVGALLIIELQPKTGLMSAYAISCAAVTAATIVVSVIFRFTLEKLASYLTSVIDKGLKRVTRCIPPVKN